MLFLSCFVQDPPNEAPVSELGLDPLQDFPLDKFRDLVSSRTAPIKAVLLDQTVTAGVGNWIADESLFQSRIHPVTHACDLTKEQVCVCARVRTWVSACACVCILDGALRRL